MEFVSKSQYLYSIRYFTNYWKSMVVDDLPVLENTFSEARKIFCLILITYVQKGIFNSRKQMLAQKITHFRTLFPKLSRQWRLVTQVLWKKLKKNSTKSVHQCNSVLFGSMRTRSNAMRRTSTRLTRTECVESAQLDPEWYKIGQNLLHWNPCLTQQSHRTSLNQQQVCADWEAPLSAVFFNVAFLAFFCRFFFVVF